MLIQECLELPRFTSNLRAYSSISDQQDDNTSETVNNKKIIKKRKQLIENQEKQTTWEDVLLKLVPNNTSQKTIKLKSHLDKLRTNLAKQFLNEDFNDAILLNEASLFLLEKFWEFKNPDAGTNQSNFQNLDKLNKKLREKFGQYARNLFDQCKDLMEQIFNEINNLNKQNDLNDLFSMNYVQLLTTKSSSLETPNSKYFGENIKFYSFYEDKIKKLKNFEAEFSSSLDTDDEETGGGDDDDDDEEEPESFQFDFSSDKQQNNSNNDEYLKLVEWTKHFSSDLNNIVYELLSKNNDINQIQNELVELLGFEKIEIVEFLLSNKNSVVKAYETYIKESASQERRVKHTSYSKPSNLTSSSGQSGAITSQIVVHTETEKKIKKLMRKEEKKLNKTNNLTKLENEFGEQFDPALLRKLREEQLSEAHVLQLYHQKRMNSLLPENLVKKVDQYPFVFDSLLKITQSTAFVAGSKILLPENIKRTDTHVFEEIFIPASDSLDLADPSKFIGSKEEICFNPLIKVSSLDEIGQLVFRNVKSLNRIQSIVFESAYMSNENLLICAPTGAGKTNIALLTIINQIKKNIIDGVLKKDDFKIVYIAPMKALAAEMVDNFSKKLAPLGIVVKELTGDIQLSKQEIMETQMLVATPEKWDVVTRKSLGDISLSLLVRLLIIDEVHLLHDERGSVIETIVARTLRQVESSQKMIRIVGLSATLPNYLDVARFLNVNPRSGLFFFDSRFRPVPLAQSFIGVKSLNKMKQQEQMDEVCYDKALKMVRQGHQVMVFVHARNATIKTALKMREMAKHLGESDLFRPEQSKEFGECQRQMARSRNKQLREIFDDGFAVHHAGMLRADRNLVERSFISGHIRVLCCTATLAWGVNLPAHAVIIKGTELYDSKKGAFVDLSMLDVLQIFGRAGRPQYDKSGEAFIITTHDKVALYLSLLTRQSPIESQFILSLADNLNAEVCLGSVTNVQEAIRWLTYTYLHVRMKSNPLAYGVTYRMLENDPGLDIHREDLIKIAARQLDKAHMLRFDETTGHLHATDLGRTASHYYIKYATIEITNLKLKEVMNDKEILSLISECSEFQQLKVRDEEMTELDTLHEACELPVMGGIESTHGKVNCLIQTYISREKIEGFSLISDMAYVVQNVSRIARALFEMSLKRGWALMTGRLLNICKSIEKQLWYFKSPMRQFENQLTYDILQKIEDGRLNIEKLKEMSPSDLGSYLRHPKMGFKVKECINYFPSIDIETSLHPITRTVLRVKITLTAEFTWNDKIHGNSEFFWVWIEDPHHNHIYHHEFFNLQKKHVKTNEPQLIVFTIPIFEPLPSQYIVRVISDRWLGVEFSHSISFKHLILPELHPPHTELLDLDPLPVKALNNPKFEALYKFSHFNPIQTQIFYCLYHTNTNCLLGAPTGSGKTIAAELAMFRVFNNGNKKVVYIAPLKALVRERMIDWKVRLEEKLGKKVVELTGDVTPDMKIVAESDVIITTPEKWDGISRSWQTRSYVKDVALIVIDEIHLLGEDRGPVLEVIVSRTNFITHHTNNPVRIIGLSTALANARDLADWLGIKKMGLYNFKPSVRPVPLEVHIQGFPGKFYCPRMATMNKPCFQEIQIHSPKKPTLIFVSSRRQTRLTALDLISCLATDSNPKQWLHMPEIEMTAITNHIVDQNLKLTLAFGIALHHAGLNDKDRKVVEELFVNQKIQILIATSTLAWGVNFPAHLVIVKGTEYYDGKTKRYVDFPITDVLQMMGRAGRPQFDDQGTAVIMVHDAKKHFYKKFLYEPFPVESNLLRVLSDHLNAEIVAATISSKQEAMDYLTWTYFFRRLLVNPTYYELESLENIPVNKYLSFLIQRSLNELEDSHCIAIADDGQLQCTELGRIASFYYLSHKTVKMFKEALSNDVETELLLDIVSMSEEFEEFPVRHNEDKLNAELSNDVPLKVNSYAFDSPHTKVNLLLQAHFSRVPLPTSDYLTDTKSVLDQCLRIMQAILDVCAYNGWLSASLSLINLMQMCCQGRWLHDCDLLTLPHIETEHLARFYNNKAIRIDCLPRLIDYLDKCNYENVLENIVGNQLDRNQIRDIYKIVSSLPQIEVNINLNGNIPTDKVKNIRIDHLNDDKIYELFENEEYVFNLDIKRIATSKRQQRDFKAYAPKYPKPKDENWVIILGSNSRNELTNELVGLKRINNLKLKQNSNISFKTPKLEDLATGLFELTLFFMSDVYIGLDQQFEFKFKLNKNNLIS